jgi:hypothetical protein
VFEIDNQAPGGSQVSKHPTLLEHIEILIKVEKIDKGIQLKLSQCKLNPEEYLKSGKYKAFTEKFFN